jgi:hypothetical protein
MAMLVIESFSLVRRRHDPYIAELDGVAVVLKVETADAGVVAHFGIVVDLDAIVEDRHPRLARRLAVLLLHAVFDVIGLPLQRRQRGQRGVVAGVG